MYSSYAFSNNSNNINTRRNARTGNIDFMTYVEAEGVYFNVIKILTIEAVQNAIIHR